MRTNTVFRLILAMLLLSLACSFSGLAPGAGNENATQEAGKFSVDKIKADYVYTSELITVIYPLYGSRLDDFVIVTLINENVTPVKVLAESEISGYTDKAIDMVDLAILYAKRSVSKLQLSASPAMPGWRFAQTRKMPATILSRQPRLAIPPSIRRWPEPLRNSMKPCRIWRPKKLAMAGSPSGMPAKKASCRCPGVDSDIFHGNAWGGSPPKTVII
jgi:hypothetical protein